MDSDCILTCNWHNWKFDLSDGKCVLGGDHVTAYATKTEGQDVWVDLTLPSPDAIRARVMPGLQTAFRKNEFGRICRELTRLKMGGLDPLDAVATAVEWSYDKFEYGTTHAFAALADWISLYHQNEGHWDRQLVCLAETVSHMAFDTLRYPEFPYHADVVSWDESRFLDAVEQEQGPLAESMIVTALQDGMTFSDLESAFTTAALAHYNSFGHSLIYVQKAREVLSAPIAIEPKHILLPLVRHICFATREDLIPEFQQYAGALQQCPTRFGCSETQLDTSGLRKGGLRSALQWTQSAMETHSVGDVFDALLQVNAQNMLQFDTTYEKDISNKVSDSVGWLAFTHAITFSNAVREQCTTLPHLWPAGLLQIACFVGRNQRFCDPTIQLKDWRVDHRDSFLSTAHDVILDNGIRSPIFGAHYLKTTLAVEAELSHAGEQACETLLAALNRLIQTPIKQKHAHRLALQAIELVSRDFPAP